MAEYDFDIGVIGGGAAGLTTASGASQLGAKTILIEKEKELGGDCLHFGCVPSKTLIKSAGVYHLMKDASRFGLPPVTLSRVDFSEVSKRIRSVIGVIQEHDSVERFCRLGVKVEFGLAEFSDEHTVKLHGKSISAKTWVIATGSSPRIPSIEGLSDTPYLTNREIFYMDKLPESMTVLGGGPIGIEMAQAFCRLGTEVTVVQKDPHILSREDSDMADRVRGFMEKEGVTFHLDSTPISVKDQGAYREVVIKKRSGEEIRLKSEVILVSSGRTPNVDGLGFDKIGLEFTSRGVKVDSRLRTNHKHIYAAGDVNGGFQFTHAAGYEGGVVLSNALFHLPRKVNYKNIPWCTYTSPELASIGMNEKAAKKAAIPYTVWTEEFSANDRALAEGEPAGLIKLLLDSREKPLGVQILGLHAGDLISEWVAILVGKVGVATVAGAIHPYPTTGEITKKVAGSVLSKKIFSDKVRKGLKFFFNLKGRACEPCESPHQM